MDAMVRFAGAICIVTIITHLLWRWTRLHGKPALFSAVIATACLVAIASFSFGFVYALLLYGAAGLVAWGIVAFEARRAAQRAAGSPATPASAATSGYPRSPELAHLQELHEKNLISDAEYEAKRAEILKRI